MPLFEIHCNDCDATTEVLLRRSDERAACPTCGTERVERLLGLPAAPSIGRSGSLPVMRPEMSGGDCGAPRCCGGGCSM